MKISGLLRLLPWAVFVVLRLPSSCEGSPYDSAAYTECKAHPEAPLYGGGILQGLEMVSRAEPAESTEAAPSSTQAYVLDDLTAGTRYAFSCWVQISGAESALVTARLATGNSTIGCIGTALARSTGCWSFLKGGFVLDSPPSDSSVLYFKTADVGRTQISVASASLQPFTVEEWRKHQDDNIIRRRKRVVVVHVADSHGNRLSQASVSVESVSKDFPFGSAIASTILGNPSYQAWFLERFNAAVFENELKWYATEPDPGNLNYTLADQMLEFVRSNGITTRGHNIFWEDPAYTPAWVRNLTGDQLRSAVDARVRGLLDRYRGEFVHWDVSNEMLHFDFYERRLGTDASRHFFDTARRSDPLATLFMNDFNVVETCVDVNSTVDSYVLRLRELAEGGAELEGIGLEGHFGKPNIPLMRAVLDKLATLGLPIWLTEIDISKMFDRPAQAAYLEEVLREGFSHPAVGGIMLWTALHPKGCYQMCLTDADLRNLPAGDVVDELLREWETRRAAGSTDDHGTYSFDAFLGEYKVSVAYENRSADSILSLSRGDETRHFSIQV